MMCIRAKRARTSAKIVLRTRRQVANHVKLRTRFVPDSDCAAVPNQEASLNQSHQASNAKPDSLFICLNKFGCARSIRPDRRTLLLEICLLKTNANIKRARSTDVIISLIHFISRVSLLLFILYSSNLIEASQYQNGHISAQGISQLKQGIFEKPQLSHNQRGFGGDLELQQQRLEADELREEHDTQHKLRVAANEQLHAMSTQDFPTPSEQDYLFANLYKPDEPAYLLIVPSKPAEGQTSNVSHHFHRIYHRNYRPSTLFRDESRKQPQQQDGHKARATETNNDDAGHSSRRDESSTPVSDDLQAAASVSESTLATGSGDQLDFHWKHQAGVVHTNGQQRVVGTPTRQTTAASFAIKAHRLPELSFRQAPFVSVASSRAAPMEISAGHEQSGARAATLASLQAAASGEGQWIPIVTSSGHNNANRRANRVNNPVETDTNRAHKLVAQAAVSNQASSALLDFPSKPALPAMPASPQPPPGAQNGHQFKPRRPHLQPTATSDSNQPTRPTASANQRRPIESQQVASSYVHHFGHPHPQAPNYYANERHQRHHQGSRFRQNHHWRQIDIAPHAYQHRRPRLNSQHENSIEHDAIEFRPNKIYKRVLLCDKTLVSLDYIRDLEPEPRPGGVNEFLNEHEINEIADNFIPGELDGAYEMIARSGSDPIESSPLTLSRQNSSDTQRLPAALLNGTNNELALETSESHAANMALDRRALLSDEDPLLRCDMWDLEKGLKSRKPPEGILRMAVKADFDTVREAINRCRQLTERTLPPDDDYRDGLEIMSSEDLVSLFSVKRGLIPGTKWCGLGDQANSYNDLGQKHRIDICCRAHDHCPIRSKPFRNDYGILNIGLYTKSHCDCDADFYRCLREVRSRTADMLGNLYFNVMKLQCMREERLKICREMKPIALGFERCIRYEESPIKRVFKFTTPPVAY